MNGILEKARAFRAGTLSHIEQTSTAPSKLWADLHASMHQPLIGGVEDIKAFTAFLTENNAFTFPRLTSDPECKAVAQRMIDYLDRSGTPLSGLAPSIQESEYAGAGVVWLENGRRVSVAFLYQVCNALRIAALAPEVETILEIGAGYGGLARTLQLVKPRRRYIILDLVDSLFCSYTFLSANFPEASMLWVEGPAQAANLRDYDFVFVPAHLVDVLQNERVDLAVNTASLGEMTQDAVNRYMALIHDSAKYFYSYNRYGQRCALCSADQCQSAIVLDSGWDVVLWDLWGESGWSHAEPAAPPSLEILVRRRAPAADPQLAAAYYQMARLVEVNSSLWHYCMWNSIRIFPARENLTAYLRQIEMSGDFNEAPFYRAKLGSAQDVSMALPVGLENGKNLHQQLLNAKSENARVAADLAAAQKENMRMAADLAAAQKENTRVTAELDKVLHSKSWSVTRPLRALESKFR